MKTFIKELVYKGCKEDFVEDKISSSIALNFNIFVSLFAATLITGIVSLMNTMPVFFAFIPNMYLGIFAFFLTVFIAFMVVLYLPGFKYQSKCLTKSKVDRPFYFITELDDNKIELKIDFDKDHRRTNKQYKIDLNTVEAVGVYCGKLSEDRAIKNDYFVKTGHNPNVEFIIVDTNKVAPLSNMGDKKLSYLVPRYDDKGTDMLVELYGLLEK